MLDDRACKSGESKEEKLWDNHTKKWVLGRRQCGKWRPQLVRERKQNNYEVQAQIPHFLEGLAKAWQCSAFTKDSAFEVLEYVQESRGLAGRTHQSRAEHS